MHFITLNMCDRFISTFGAAHILQYDRAFPLYLQKFHGTYLDTSGHATRRAGIPAFYIRMKLTAQRAFRSVSPIFSASRLNTEMFLTISARLKHLPSEMRNYNNFTHTLLILHLKHGKGFFHTLCSNHLPTELI